MRQFLLLVILAIALSACARASTRMLDADTAIISGKGSAFDDHASVVQATLKEAANATIARGYRYFVIEGSRDTTTTATWVQPGQTYSSGTMTGSAYSYGSTTNLTGAYSGSTYSTPTMATTFIKPGVDMMINMFREGEVNPGATGVWDAAEILRSLGSEVPGAASSSSPSTPTTATAQGTQQSSSTASAAEVQVASVARYHVVAYDDRGAVFEGTIIVGMGGGGTIQLTGNDVVCSGATQQTVATEYVIGSEGVFQIYCGNGRTISGKWVQTSAYGGEGTGSDQFGKPLFLEYNVNASELIETRSRAKELAGQSE